jgi:hypothetical protein
MLQHIIVYNRMWHFGLVLAGNDPKFPYLLTLKRSP